MVRRVGSVRHPEKTRACRVSSVISGDVFPMNSSRCTFVIGSGIPKSPFCPVSDCHELAWVCGPWYLLGRPTCAHARFRDSRKPGYEAGCAYLEHLAHERDAVEAERVVRLLD